MAQKMRAERKRVMNTISGDEHSKPDTSAVLTNGGIAGCHEDK
jgi:hypothetical protein